MFYGSQQSSTFEARKNIGSSLIDSDNITKEVMQIFFEKFQVRVKHLQDQCNEEIKNLVKKRKNQKPCYIQDEHPISPNKVYQELYLQKVCHLALLRLFKFSMLSESFQYRHSYQ